MTITDILDIQTVEQFDRLYDANKGNNLEIDGCRVGFADGKITVRRPPDVLFFGEDNSVAIYRGRGRNKGLVIFSVRYTAHARTGYMREYSAKYLNGHDAFNHIDKGFRI